MHSDCNRAFSSAVNPVARVSNWQSWREGSNGQQGTKKVLYAILPTNIDQHIPRKRGHCANMSFEQLNGVSHNPEARSKKLKKELWEQCPEALIGDLPDLKNITYLPIHCNSQIAGVPNLNRSHSCEDSLVHRNPCPFVFSQVRIS